MSQIMCEATLAHVGDLPFNFAISRQPTNSFIDVGVTAVEFDTDVCAGSRSRRRGDRADVMRVKS
jgi:hypothetical protein